MVSVSVLSDVSSSGIGDALLLLLLLLLLLPLERSADHVDERGGSSRILQDAHAQVGFGNIHTLCVQAATVARMQPPLCMAC